MAVLARDNGDIENFEALIEAQFYILINKRLEFIHFIEDSFLSASVVLLVIFLSSNKNLPEVSRWCFYLKNFSPLPTVIPEEPEKKGWPERVL